MTSTFHWNPHPNPLLSTSGNTTMYKILGSDGREYGPVSAEQIRQWIAARRCTSLTLAKPEGSNDWKQLAQLPEFAQTLTQYPSSAGAPPIQAAPAKPRGSGLPIIAVIAIVCFGGIFFVGLLAAIAIPNFVRAKKQAQTNICHNHIQQLSSAMHQYLVAHDEKFPAAESWSDSIKGTVTSTDTFTCPLSLGNSCAYAFNSQLAGKKLSEVNAMTVMLFESDAGWNGSGGQDQMVARDHIPAADSHAAQGERVLHVVFVNGEFASMPESGLKSLRWDP
jgi:competence protein ComGC